MVPEVVARVKLSVLLSIYISWPYSQPSLILIQPLHHLSHYSLKRVVTYYLFRSLFALLTNSLQVTQHENI